MQPHDDQEYAEWVLDEIAEEIERAFVRAFPGLPLDAEARARIALVKNAAKRDFMDSVFPGYYQTNRPKPRKNGL